jgi:hypothetical protein
MADPVDLSTLSDEEINRRKFTLMKRICDEKKLPYHPSLVSWLERQESGQ